MNLELKFIGKSGSIKKIREDFPQLSRLSRILITGEPGTGKSLAARLIHESSKSHTKLLTLHPSSSHEENITEAFKSLTANTTLLIQGIEEFPFVSQGNIAQHLNTLHKKHASQIIVTSKKNIQELKKEGGLLKDIYEILRTFHTITIPPLNKRTEDIPLLVEHFIKNACESVGTKLKVIDINALDFLIRREWKGNVLELKSVIEKTVLTSDKKTIELPDYLIDEYAQFEGIISNIKEKKSFPFDKSLSNLEKTLIEKTLEAVGYHQAKAAELLNITPENLRYRLRKFKIQF